MFDCSLGTYISIEEYHRLAKLHIDGCRSDVGVLRNLAEIRLADIHKLKQSCEAKDKQLSEAKTEVAALRQRAKGLKESQFGLLYGGHQQREEDLLRQLSSLSKTVERLNQDSSSQKAALVAAKNREDALTARVAASAPFGFPYGEHNHTESFGKHSKALSDLEAVNASLSQQLKREQAQREFLLRRSKDYVKARKDLEGQLNKAMLERDEAFYVAETLKRQSAICYNSLELRVLAQQLADSEVGHKQNLAKVEEERNDAIRKLRDLESIVYSDGPKYVSEVLLEITHLRDLTCALKKQLEHCRVENRHKAKEVVSLRAENIGLKAMVDTEDSPHKGAPIRRRFWIW